MGFVAVDWGTSSFRLWLIGAGGKVLGESRSHEGMQHCNQHGFAPVLQAHLAKVGADPALPVLICGMAGARQGWFEAPYADLPAPIAAIAALAVRLPVDRIGDLGHDIRILPGLAQRDPTRPDVMRGEETQLLGLAKQGIEGLACMPGTHCKWARLQAGAVVDFQSYMTGELFDVLSRQSILRHAMPDERQKIAPDNADFLAALDLVLDDPAGLLPALFPVRAGQLLDFRSKEASAARLSGLMIGAEVGRQIAGARGVPVTLVGQEGLGALYAAALERAGAVLNFADAELATRVGLIAAAAEIWPSAGD